MSEIKTDSVYKFKRTDYKIKDFEYINKCAYFDYQRNKVYLRNNKKVKKALKNKEKQNKLINKPDKQIFFIPENCSHCNHGEFKKIKTTRKLTRDLKFMKNGIKKWVLEFHGGTFLCCKCGKTITPKNFMTIPYCGHNLKIWSINQYIQYRVSCEQIVEMVLDSFNIQVSLFEMFKFKRTLAEKYKNTYEEIRRCVLNGNLIHADETTAQIRGPSSGYVWVFSNMDSVFYLYKPTREAGFLHAFLDGFNGVLISDFYSGYDSLPFKQQKCLVHLIRDLNEDLLNNQFNDEYKSIITEFGKMLRVIIETIDNYGLKKRHLNKHKKDVEKFFKQEIDKKFETELAIKYQKNITFLVFYASFI